MATIIEVTIYGPKETILEVLEAVNKKAREHNQFAKNWGGAGPNQTRLKAEREKKAESLEKIHTQIKEQLSP